MLPFSQGQVQRLRSHTYGILRYGILSPWLTRASLSRMPGRLLITPTPCAYDTQKQKMMLCPATPRGDKSAEWLMLFGTLSLLSTPQDRPRLGLTWEHTPAQPSLILLPLLLFSWDQAFNKSHVLHFMQGGRNREMYVKSLVCCRCSLMLLPTPELRVWSLADTNTCKRHHCNIIFKRIKNWKSFT